MRWIVWGAMFASLFVYLFVIQFAGTDSKGEEPDRTLAYTFVGFGLLSAAISVGISFVVKRLRTPEGKPKTPSWIDSAFIVALAMGETPAIFGLVLALTGHAKETYLPLFLVAMVVFVLIAPIRFFPKEKSQSPAR